MFPVIHFILDRGERIIRIVEAEYLYSYSYSGDFLKPNIIHIRIRVIFSILNTINILLSIDTFDKWAPILNKWAHENLSPHFHFSDDRINQSSEKMSG